jgi:hypothetical protein
MRYQVSVIFFMVIASCAARAATIEDVDALQAKGKASLQDTSVSKRVAMQTAILYFRQALDTLEKVDGLTEGQRDDRATALHAVIFWAGRFMPIGGDEANVPPKAGPAPAATAAAAPEAVEQVEEKETTPSKPKGVTADQAAFEQAQKFAKSHEAKPAEVAMQFSGVAARFPDGAWGQKAAGEAQTWRQKASDDAARHAGVVPDREARIQRLELDGLLKDYDDRIAVVERAASVDAPARAALAKGREEIARLKRLREDLIAIMAAPATAQVSFESLGLTGDKVVMRANDSGLIVGPAGSTEPQCMILSWQKAGARAMVRLAAEMYRISKGKVAETAVAAVIVGDHATAFRLFEDLMKTAPERLAESNEYFLRAQEGYAASYAGLAENRMRAARAAVDRKDFPAAMKAIDALCADLARDSTLEKKYLDVKAFRSEVMWKNDVDGEGRPISLFDRKIRRVFGGDVKLDEATGRITAEYDFDEERDAKDWTRPGGWTYKDGKMQCSSSALRGMLPANAGAKDMLTWNFPVQDASVTAKMTRSDGDRDFTSYIALNVLCPDSKASVSGAKAAVGQTGGGGGGGQQAIVQGRGRHGRMVMQQQQPQRGGTQQDRPQEVRAGEILVRIGGTRASINNYILRNVFFTWKDNETAFVAVRRKGDDLSLVIGGQRAAQVRAPGDEYGGVGFAFSKQEGSVDNVKIEGVLDMEWFNEKTKDMK